MILIVDLNSIRLFDFLYCFKKKKKKKLKYFSWLVKNNLWIVYVILVVSFKHVLYLFFLFKLC